MCPPATNTGSAPAPVPGGEPRRVLVSGGAGFIGSHLTDLLLAQGAHVTVVDDLSTGRPENLPEAHPRLRFVHADLKQAIPTLAAASRDGFHEIYHLAAAVGVKLVLDEPIRCIDTNVEQTSAILRFATRASPAKGPVPILVASSSEVYGKGTQSPFREDDDVVYGPTTATRWSYACAKAIDEHLALAYHAKHALPVVVARFFNTVGPRQVGDYGMVLPRFVQKALAGHPLEVFGDGSQSRCFCDVRDVAQVLPRMLAEPACHGRVFNVGSDRPHTIRELADLVIATLASPSRVVQIPYEKAYARGFEDLRQRRPSLERLRSTLRFEPSIPLERTIRDLAEAMRHAPKEVHA